MTRKRKPKEDTTPPSDTADAAPEKTRAPMEADESVGDVSGPASSKSESRSLESDAVVPADGEDPSDAREAAAMTPEHDPADNSAPEGDESGEEPDRDAAATAPADESASDEADEEYSETTSAPAGEPVEITTARVIEAVLFTTDAPLTPAKIVSIIGVGTARDVRQYVDSLNREYTERGAAFHIEKIAGGYQMLTRPEFNTWLRRLKQNRQDSRLSQAALETLAVVAYKQPVVRADIEAIRGVAAGEMLNRLRELGLIKIVGRAEDVGRPILYGTTKRFLEVFGLSGLDDLPQVEELQAPA
jgi:segregation and condensation protein B